MPTTRTKAKATRQKAPRKRSPRKSAAVTEQTTGTTPRPETLPPPATNPTSLSGRVAPGDVLDPEAATEAPPVPGIPPSTLEPVVRLPFVVWARVAGDPSYELNNTEAGLLAEATAPVADKYLPAGAASPEVVLLMVLATIVVPRLAKPKPEAEDKPQARDKDVPYAGPEVDRPKPRTSGTTAGAEAGPIPE